MCFKRFQRSAENLNNRHPADIFDRFAAHFFQPGAVLAHEFRITRGQEKQTEADDHHDDEQDAQPLVDDEHDDCNDQRG